MEIEKIKYYKEDYDLHNCDKEPLQRIRRIQDYGSIIICDESGSKWYYASEDIVEKLNQRTVKDMVSHLVGVDFEYVIASSTNRYFSSEHSETAVLLSKRKNYIILEFEPKNNVPNSDYVNSRYGDTVIEVSSADDHNTLIEKVLEQVHITIGYDHIMIYKFDEDHNGEVIAEKKHEDSPSYMGLKFPASDIPDQARALYFKEKIRIIHDATHEGHVIVENDTIDGPELDLTEISSRGVSPIHREYLGYMGVRSSFSVAVIIKDKLWGLIACHNRKPKLLSYHARKWVKFLSELISLNWEKTLNQENDIKRVYGQLIQSKIMENVQSSKDLINGLLEEENNITNLIIADGAAVITGPDIKTTGLVPDIKILNQYRTWLSKLGHFETKSYQKTKGILPEPLYDPELPGMLILQLSEKSQDYLIWFRREEVKQVSWGGNPEHVKKFDQEKGRMTPRKSFDAWQENVKDSSRPWDEMDAYFAIALKKELKNHLYQKYNEVLLLNNELNEAYKDLETFSYTVSHDLKAPLRSIEGFSQILKEEYGEVLDENGLRLLDIITNSISKMKKFIEEILTYSKLNQKTLDVQKLNIDDIIKENWTMLSQIHYVKPKLYFEGNCGEVYGDEIMINQLFQNLFSNSIKYVEKGVTPEVRISHEHDDKYLKIMLEDNGIGIPANQREKVFEVFKRLVNDKDYEGTGVGLSTIKKVIDKHSGTIKIEDPLQSTVGTRFVITLPSRPEFIDVINKRN